MKKKPSRETHTHVKTLNTKQNNFDTSNIAIMSKTKMKMLRTMNSFYYFILFYFLNLIFFSAYHSYLVNCCLIENGVEWSGEEKREKNEVENKKQQYLNNKICDI